MLLNQNNNLMNNKFDNNMLSSWRTQIVNIINNNSFRNSMNNNNNNNFNNRFNNSANNNINFNFNNNAFKKSLNNNHEKIITIIFNYVNKFKCPIVIFPNIRLMNIFSLVSIQIGDSVFSNIYGLAFYYNTENITSHFFLMKM